MLETRNLHAYYGEGHVLRGVDLRVEKGEVVTLVGRNGAGKTTTLKSIMGLVSKQSGEIVFDERSIAGLTSDKIARRGIGFVPEERGIYASLTVLENLTMPVIVGETELAANQFAVKDLATGNQTTVPRGQLIAQLKSLTER